MSRENRLRAPLFRARVAAHAGAADLLRGRTGLGPYADFVAETDAAIGEVLQALEQSGAAKNTLVLFASDNGPAPIAG